MDYKLRKFNCAFDYIHQRDSGQKSFLKTIKDGGVAVAVAKMSFGNLLGAEISITMKNYYSRKNIGGLVINLQKN